MMWPLKRARLDLSRLPAASACSLPAVLAMVCFSATAMADQKLDAKAPAATLSWSQETGVVLQSPLAIVLLDRGTGASGPVLVFPEKGLRLRPSTPKVEQPNDHEVVLRYQVTGPEDNRIEVSRRIVLSEREAEVDVIEEVSLTSSKTISTDLEIERPFSLRAAGNQPASARPQAVLPLYNGWARSFSLGGDMLRGEWQLCNLMRNAPSQQLGLPVVQFGQERAWLAAVCADPYLGSLYELSAAEGQVFGAVRYRYAASYVPLAAGHKETRLFGFWCAAARQDEPFGRSIDAFFRLMLPDVPPGPKWLHEIAMVGYDYLSENGQGFEKDVKELARLLTPAERRRVALCYHGWYETIGGYSYDDAKKQIKDRWVAMGRTRKVQLTQDEVRRQLKFARDAGFRVLWYFGDGLLQDAGAPEGYRPEWDCVDQRGVKITGWTGPDTWGTTFVRNPAHPQVFQWYQDYMAALVKAFGPVIDGFVWDETMHARAGMIARSPQPAYCDLAMLRLVKALTAQVHAADPQKVFLSSDCAGWVGTNGTVPGYAMMADGIFQDTGCLPHAWPFGFFPTWRNTMWSCNWGSVSRFHNTRWSVEHYGTPVAISNGWGDDIGPSEWKAADRDNILRLFRQRLARAERVRYLATDPLTDVLRPSDPVPQPAPGEVNWALASQGGKATASSVGDFWGGQWGPSGLIDGRRDTENWGKGHGWASREHQALPQWVEVAFPAPRNIARFVVVTYHGKQPGDSAAVWGVTNYEIQVWDEAHKDWTTLVKEDRGRAMMTRVHALTKPVRTTKFRILVSRVAAVDDVARLLQLEAWGVP